MSERDVVAMLQSLDAGMSESEVVEWIELGEALVETSSDDRAASVSEVVPDAWTWALE